MATNDFIQQLANGLRRGIKNTADKIDVSQFLKNLAIYSTGSQAARDTIQNLKNVSLANQVKRVEAPEFTTDQLANMGGSENFMALPENQDYQNRLRESQVAYSSLQDELANPTANATFNRIFNVSPEEQQRQSGAQMYGITQENPQGELLSPTVLRDLASGAGTALGAGIGPMTRGMAGVPGAFTRIAGNAIGSAGQGFGESVPSSAGMDTLIAMLLGGGGSAIGEYADNPEFRQFIKDNNSGKYDAYIMYGDEIGNNDTKTGQTYDDLRKSIQNDATPQSLIDEAKKYKSADEFIKAQEQPKTVSAWVKSKFSDTGSYADIPVIRKEENITLYQGGVGENRQFWTPDKKYAEQFGDVAKKTGTFYKLDNGNRVTDVYIEAPTKSQLTDIWNKAQDIPINKRIENIKPEPGTYGYPGSMNRKIGTGNDFVGSGKPGFNPDNFVQMLMNGEDLSNIIENLNADEKGMISDIIAENGLIKNETSNQIRRRIAINYPEFFRELIDDNKPYHRK